MHLFLFVCADASCFLIRAFSPGSRSPLIYGRDVAPLGREYGDITVLPGWGSTGSDLFLSGPNGLLPFQALPEWPYPPGHGFTTEAQRGRAATKFETRNSKLETNSNGQKFKQSKQVRKRIARNLDKISRN